MHGNVNEWCRDWRQKELPSGRDPEVTTKGSSRVSRGGGWVLSSGFCRCAARYAHGPGFRGFGLGFRFASVQSSQ